MRFSFTYPLMSNDLENGLQRFIAFLREHEAEEISNVEINCYPWRNGKRLQAVNGNGQIRPIVFDAENAGTGAPPFERLTIRERPDSLPVTGLASLFDHDD